MKLRILAAASALAVAGVAFAVYRETRPDTDTTAAASTVTPATPVERGAPSIPMTTDIPRPPAGPTAAEAAATSATAAGATAMSAARTSAPAAPALPASAGARPDREAAAVSSSQAQSQAGSAALTPHGLSAIKVRDPATKLDPASESPLARQRRMNRTLESAACHAPDLERRYQTMPEKQRAALRARCANYGVKLPDPS